ncbi:DUF1003 domain-containing protein [Yinghuangia sp. ASG 101]|uniref:DUF1003 domain-containing protein n=1 Tax=Yinghuangia sp. ASG 101 TaxID=2896848 RepID=UPI001E3ADCB5|nr:DUF1003 domain-containing protein [Yinghuangia sp. ASG 101]UGQ09487.1 DUF1003 domain-containing protein [Yinghuangia sp. ASG 101]
MAREPQSTLPPEERRRRPRLDQPTLPRRRLSPFPKYDPESFGQFSERIARFLGTGRFLVYMTGTIILWVLWNVSLPSGLRFDEYPFIFLTLALSLQASYAAPLILLAQNRQDDRDRVNLEQDRARNERNIADTEYLTREVAALRIALGEVATRDFLRSELQALVKELDGRRDTDQAHAAVTDVTGDGGDTGHDGGHRTGPGGGRDGGGAGGRDGGRSGPPRRGGTPPGT